MELPVALNATDPTSAIDDLTDFYGDGPVPVVDGEHRLLGVVRR